MKTNYLKFHTIVSGIIFAIVLKHNIVKTIFLITYFQSMYIITYIAFFYTQTQRLFLKRNNKRVKKLLKDKFFIYHV